MLGGSFFFPNLIFTTCSSYCWGWSNYVIFVNTIPLIWSRFCTTNRNSCFFLFNSNSNDSEALIWKDSKEFSLRLSATRSKMASTIWLSVRYSNLGRSKMSSFILKCNAFRDWKCYSWGSASMKWKLWKVKWIWVIFSGKWDNLSIKWPNNSEVKLVSSMQTRSFGSVSELGGGDFKNLWS